MNKFSVRLKILSIFLLLTSEAIFSQLKIEITEGIREPIRIAIVPFSQNSSSTQKFKLHSIITKDLESFGEFEAIKSEDMLSYPSNQEEVFYRDWRLLKVNYLLIGSFEESEKDNEITVSYNIFDISREKRLYTGLISSQSNSWRKLAHRISDRFYQKINGIPGIFTTRIAYIEEPKLQEEKYHLKVSDIDGENNSLVFSSSQPLMSPDWSPDSKKLAYVSFENGFSQIFIQELASGKRQSIKSSGGINSSPSWSPNGRYIAAVLSKSGNPDIYIYDLNKNSWKQVTDHFGIDTEPTWSSNGKKILFTSNRSGSPQIYELTISNGRIKRKTFEGSYNARGRYLPGGRHIALIHRRKGLFHVAIQNIRNGNLKILTDTFLDESPTISPNGNIIIYATKKNQRGILAGITVNNITKFILPSIIGEVREPAWSPLVN